MKLQLLILHFDAKIPSFTRVTWFIFIVISIKVAGKESVEKGK